MVASHNMTHYIFIYGTLLPGLDLYPHMLGGTWVADARCNAHLYDLGEYPGITRSMPGDPSCVTGKVYAVDESHLHRLDDLEGLVPGNDEASLYLRQRITLVDPGDLLSYEVWGYFYNGSLAGCPRIHSGDYKEYLSSKSSGLRGGDGSCRDDPFKEHIQRG